MKKKKTFRSILLIAILTAGMLAIFGGTASAAVNPYLCVWPDQVIYIGTTDCEYNNTVFTVEVQVINVTDCQGVDFWLNYNSTLLSKEGLVDTDGPFDSGNPPISDWGIGGDASVPGTVKVSHTWIMDPPFNGTGTVCAITFKIIYCPPQNNTVSCDLAFYELRAKIYDPLGDPQPRDPSVNGYYEYTTIYPSSVGGIYIPVNKLQLLAPYIGLTMLLAAAAVTVVYVKKRKRHTETIS